MLRLLKVTPTLRAPDLQQSPAGVFLNGGDQTIPVLPYIIYARREAALRLAQPVRRKKKKKKRKKQKLKIIATACTVNAQIHCTISNQNITKEK